MATIPECRAALKSLSENLASARGEVRRVAALDRSVSCHLTDLDITFVGRLAQGRIEVVDTVPGPPEHRAAIRLALSSDDLVAMVRGELGFPRAWGTGRVRVDAGFRDLLRLRSLI